MQREDMSRLPRMQRLAWPPLSLMIISAITGCAELEALRNFQALFVEEFGSEPARLNIGNGTMTVIFVNAPEAALPEEERAKFALRVAEFVRDEYENYAELETVQVGFTSQSSVGPVSVSRTNTPYTFNTSDLGAPSPASRSGA